MAHLGVGYLIVYARHRVSFVRRSAAGRLVEDLKRDRPGHARVATLHLEQRSIRVSLELHGGELSVLVNREGDSAGMEFRLTAALVLLVAVVGAEQQPPGFRSGIDLVTLDVTAIGQDGWPVRDLRLGELTLTIDGQARSIKARAMMMIWSVPESCLTGSPACASPQPFSSCAS